MANGRFPRRQARKIRVEASETEGIDVRTGVDIENIEKHGNGFAVRTAQGERFETDLVVHGAGRVPDLETLGLEAAGIEYSDRGIAVDRAMRTSNRQVFAVGDCAATIQLARVDWLYFQARLDALEALCAGLEEPVLAHGDAAQKVSYYASLVMAAAVW